MKNSENVGTVSPQRFIFDSGRLPLRFRGPCAAFSLVWFAVAADTIARHFFGLGVLPGEPRESAPWWVIVFITVAGGLAFVSVWFMQVQIYVDAASYEIVRRYWGGRSAMRVSAAATTAVMVRLWRSFPASRRWHVELAYDDRTRRSADVFDFHRRNDALKIARRIADALQLPVVER